MQKNSLLMLTASAILVSGLAGCADEGVALDSRVEGTPTEMSIDLKFQHNTRATSDLNATEAEAAVKRVDIYIYNESGDFLSHNTLTADDISTTSGGPGYDAYQTKPIPVTTGTRSVQAGINLPADVASLLEGKPRPTAASAVQTIPPANINSTNGLPMFSIAAASATFGEDVSANKVTLTVKRLVAKVTVETDPQLDQGSHTGKLGELTFALNNRNTKVFLQQGAAPGYADPNWSSAQYNALDFQSSALPDYVKVAIGPQSSINNYAAAYALENTSEQRTKKELTRVTVRATFMPDIFWRLINGQLMLRNNTGTAPATFYTVVTPGNPLSVVYFDNATDAGTYAASVNTTYTAYPDGYCYWSFYVHNDRPGDLLRNTCYRCIITRIFPPGQPTDALKDPDAQPGAFSDIFVDVREQFFNIPEIYSSQTLTP